MCGINGIVFGAASRGRDARRDIAAMNQALQHRGPDDEGQYHDAGVALGFRRLAINDLSAAGHQPMRNEDGTLWLVFNGEIYNHLELAPELRARGHVFASRCDAEVVLHAYEEWGEDCVQRFNGMWAFALWDTRRQRLFASRDRFGVKPFVYLRRDGEFSFSSEVAGLRAVHRLHQAHLGKLHDYLAHGARANDGETMFAEVHELPPGHHLVLDAAGLQVRPWWRLSDANVSAQPVDHAVNHATALRELLADAVRLRLRSDVPVALLQSGGLDSSAICALVDDEVAAGRAGGAHRVTAFTAVHPGHAYDESARVAALMQSCPHIDSVLLQPPTQDLAARLPAFVRAMQEPMFSTTAYAHWCLMQAVRERGTKVMLNGQGADEALAGYGRYIAGAHLLDTLLSRPTQVPQAMRDIEARQGVGVAQQMAQTAKAMLGRRAAAAWRGWVSEGASRYLSRELRGAARTRLPEARAGLAPRHLDAQLRSQLLHHGFNQILHYEDLSSMSQSIEMRSPFVDYRVMAFALALPMAERFSQGITKRVLRRAFASRLPATIVDEQRKIGFATPFDEWRATPAFRAFVAELVATPEFLTRRIWHGPSLAAALTGKRAVPRDFPHWRFIHTELWLREFGITNA